MDNITVRPGYPLRVNNESVKVSAVTPLKPNRFVVKGNVMYVPDLERIVYDNWPRC